MKIKMQKIDLNTCASVDYVADLQSERDEKHHTYSLLHEGFRTDWKPVKTIKIKFRGIDHWNRPVFKDVDSNNHYGSVSALFNYEDSAEKVIAYFTDHLDELEYFGLHLGGLVEGIIFEVINFSDYTDSF